MSCPALCRVRCRCCLTAYIIGTTQVAQTEHLSCATCLRSVLLIQLSSDRNECFAACRLIFTMLYLTFNDKQNKHIFFSKSREHTAYAVTLRSPKISREHTRMPAYHCHYNTDCSMAFVSSVVCNYTHYYPVNPSSDNFHTATVAPSSDHCRTEAVLPPSDHYCIETVAPSGDNYYI